MTDKLQWMHDLYCVLTTLLDVERELGEGVTVAESTIYTAMQCDLQRFLVVLCLSIQNGWIDRSPGHRIALSPKGREKALDLERRVEAMLHKPE